MVIHALLEVEIEVIPPRKQDPGEALTSELTDTVKVGVSQVAHR